MGSQGVATVVEGVPERRLTRDELLDIYGRCHGWLHEFNPYVNPDPQAFVSINWSKLVTDRDRVQQFIERHFIAINGRGYFCVLWDSVDNQTKCLPLNK